MSVLTTCPARVLCLQGRATPAPRQALPLPWFQVVGLTLCQTDVEPATGGGFPELRKHHSKQGLVSVTNSLIWG